MPIPTGGDDPVSSRGYFVLDADALDSRPLALRQNLCGIMCGRVCPGDCPDDCSVCLRHTADGVAPRRYMAKCMGADYDAMYEAVNDLGVFILDTDESDARAMTRDPDWAI